MGWGQLAHAQGDALASPSERLPAGAGASPLAAAWLSRSSTPRSANCLGSLRQQPMARCQNSLLRLLQPLCSSVSQAPQGQRQLALSSMPRFVPAPGWLITVGGFAGLPGSVGGRGSEGMAPTMPPGLQHWHLLTPVRHKTDVLRRLIHALDAQRILVFMNWQSRLKVRAVGRSAPWGGCLARLVWRASMPPASSLTRG